MIRYLLLLLLYTGILSQSQAQIAPTITNEARFVIRPYLFAQYNLYHWYQQPLYQTDGQPKNVGAALNILPGLGGGILMGKKTTLLFAVESSLQYMPLAMDLNGFDGIGALSWPVLVHFRIPLEKFAFLQIGGGVQWNKINLHHNNAANSFFMTYVGEVGFGIEETAFGLLFTRLGYHPNHATTLDVGVKFGINGSLWD